MPKQTIHGTLSFSVTNVPVTLELELPDPPGPEPVGGSWARDILGTSTPTAGLNGPMLTQQAQAHAFDLPESLRDLPERDDLQAQIDRATGVCVLEPGIYRCSATIDKPLEVRGQQRVSVRATDNWSHAPWTQTGSFWNSVWNVPNWEPEPLETWQAHDPWKAGRPWIVMVDGVRQYIEPGTQPTAGHFCLDPNLSVILPFDPRGHLVEVSVRGGPGAWLNILSDNVVLDSIDFRHAPSGCSRWNALESNTHTIAELHCMFGWTHATGPAPGGSHNAYLEDNVYHNSGMVGLGAPDMHSLSFRNNVLFNNGFGEGWVRENGSGGIKVVGGSAPLFEGNAAWNNNMSGLWVDIDCRDSWFKGNVCWDNGANQIHYEISQSSTIEDNVVFRTPHFAAPGLTERTLGIYVSSSRQVHVAGNLAMHLPSGYEFRALTRGDMPPGGIYDIQHEECTYLGRYNPPDQAAQWGQDFGIFWGDNGDGATINQTSNWARNNRYSWNGPEPSYRWAYQPGHDVWVDRLETFQQLNSGTTSIGGGASYLSESERQESLRRFGLSD